MCAGVSSISSQGPRDPKGPVQGQWGWQGPSRKGSEEGRVQVQIRRGREAVCQGGQHKAPQGGNSHLALMLTQAYSLTVSGQETRRFALPSD